MPFKKIKCIFLCTAMVLSGILLSGCDSSSAEFVDEITAETITPVTAETTKTTAETVSETTTVTTTEITTEIAAKTTAEADTEVPTPIEPTTEVQTEATTETTNDLTPEELEVYNSMPDIVFVLSHTYYTYPNIRGFYITKNGEIKMYAFSDEKEGVYTAVPEIYDELENVTCSELSLFDGGHEITQDDLDTAAISDLIELYNKLLLVDEKSEFEERNNYCDVVNGIFELYGIRTNKNGGKEIILLSLKGDYYLISEDIYAREISDEVYNIGYPFSRYSGI